MSSEKVQVRLFPAPPAASCCDSSSEVSLHPNEELTERMDAVELAFDGRVNMELASYATREGIFAAIEQLNAALSASGRDEVVSPANFYGFIGSVAPIIVIDGRVAFTGSVPDWLSLRSAIERSLVPA